MYVSFSNLQAVLSALSELFLSFLSALSHFSLSINPKILFLFRKDYYILFIILLFLVFLHWILVPAGYLYILLFLKSQNQKILSMTLNTVISRRRRQKNIVNIGK